MPHADAFRTESGDPVPAVDAAEMREVDRLATAVHGPNLFQMMENAGRNLALTAMDLLGTDWNLTPILVLAGSGGNGGGGITAARHLANRGADVTVAVTDEHRLSEVPSAQLDLFRSTSGRLVDTHQIGQVEPSLVVDAIIGYSLRGEPVGTALAMIAYANDADATVLSLDVPSGLDATTGESPGESVAADVTMTLALPKLGLGAASAGRLRLADIGIPAAVYRNLGIEGTDRIFGRRFVIPVERA
jgi:NAD(P)H-hydrate epimerase